MRSQFWWESRKEGDRCLAERKMEIARSVLNCGLESREYGRKDPSL
jgi:hypothetical protein